MAANLVHKGWSTKEFDVKSAFSNEDIDREIFFGLPRNLTHEMKKGFAYRLIKALYGINQAPVARRTF